MIISQTPLRISFLGGGTDLPSYFEKNEFGGQVISTTIDKYVYVLVTKRSDKLIYVGYSQQEICENIDEIKHDLVRECAKLCKMDNSFEVKTMADIPSTGSGLGSSSAITVGLLNAFHAFKGDYASPKRLAEEACHIEVDILKNPIGFQDQYACAFGGFNHLIFKSGRNIKVRKLGEFDAKNYLIYPTGIARKSSDILKTQQTKINKNEYLYKQLCDLVTEFLSHPEESLFALPELILKDWKIKEQLIENNSEINDLFNKLENAGATHYKLLGAGGGGHVLVFSTIPEIIRMEMTTQGIYDLPFTYEPFGSKIIFNFRR